MICSSLISGRSTPQFVSIYLARKIILCFREWKGWEESAIEHGIKGYLDIRPKWLPDQIDSVEGIYKFLYDHTEYLLGRLPEKAVRYDFGDDQSLISTLEFIGYTGSKSKHSGFKTWRGSRYAK